MTSEVLPKPPASNKQVQEYMEAVRKGLNSWYVVEKDGGWSVRYVAGPKGSAVYFETKDEALAKARAEAAPKKSNIFVFDLNGSLIGEERHS